MYCNLNMKGLYSKILLYVYYRLSQEFKLVISMVKDLSGYLNFYSLKAEPAFNVGISFAKSKVLRLR